LNEYVSLDKKNIKWKNMSTGHRCPHFQLKKPLQIGKSVVKSEIKHGLL
jgi:hypothetical protein